MIEVTGLTRYYGDFPAVQNVSFSIGEKVIVGFLGLNGAGKSTVLKVLGGLLMPSAGTVKFKGIDVLDAPDSLRKRIGYLPEDPPLYKEMRVNDFLKWCGEIKGMSRAEVDARLPEVITLCQLKDVEDRIIGELSHGFKKRVGIAQAVIHKPELVILDEPISGLDPVQIVEMRQVLKSLKSTCTVLISSHILGEISQTCDRILVLHGGTIAAEGTEAELSEKLSKGNRIELVLRGDIEVARGVLDDASLVQVRLTPLREDRFKAVITMDDDSRETVVASLVGAGLGLRSMAEAHSGELEDVFLGLTKTPNTDGTQGQSPKPAAAAETADTEEDGDAIQVSDTAEDADAVGADTTEDEEVES